MADWTKPGLTDTYTNFLQFLKDRDTDAATMAETPTTPPTGFIRYNTTLFKFQRWSGAAWIDIVLSLAGGGTGTTTPFGNMAYQDSGAISVSGGTISGLSAFSFSCDLLPNASGVRNLGSNALKMKNAYIGTGLVIPVGTNKWVSS